MYLKPIMPVSFRIIKPQIILLTFKKAKSLHTALFTLYPKQSLRNYGNTSPITWRKAVFAHLRAQLELLSSSCRRRTAV
jgi:hypothetical protein